MMKHASAFRPAPCLSVLLLLLLLAPAMARAQDQPDCTRALATAEDYYFTLRFGEAIQLLEQCLTQGAFSEAQQQSAYILLSKTYLRNDQVEEAKTRLRVLLALDPTYTPDPVQDTPSFIALVEETRREMQQAGPVEPEVAQNAPPRKGGIGKWLLIGGGALAAGTAALLLAGGGGGGGDGGGDGVQQLPSFPSFPSGN